MNNFWKLNIRRIQILYHYYSYKKINSMRMVCSLENNFSVGLWWEICLSTKDSSMLKSTETQTKNKSIE